MLTDDQILAGMRERVHHPATAKELLQLLKIAKDQRTAFKRRLHHLVASGDLIEVRGQRFGLPDLMNLIVGRVSTNPRGFGFVDPEAPGEGVPASIYIAGNNLNQAVHGDRVVVRIEHEREDGKAEGRIVRILERSTRKIVGRYEVDESGLGVVVPFDRRMTLDLQVPRGEARNATPGEMVTAEITRWPTATRPALGSTT
jgi:ribonuclease R